MDRPFAAAALLYLVVLGLVTAPQLTDLTSASGDKDVYFSIWRLAWIAHALATDPTTVFHGNIFFPTPYTLAFSDAVLLPGVLAAPLFWAGVDPRVIYTVVLLSGFYLSALAAYLLARQVTGDGPAALLAGLVFGFVPYRIARYMHLEAQLLWWMPLALLALHRLWIRPRLLLGVLLGLLVAAQYMSSLVAAIFFTLYLAVVGGSALLACGLPPRRAAAALLAAALAGGAAIAPYARVYFAAEAVVGSRDTREIHRYSAEPRNYLAAPQENRLYGWTAERFGGPERVLFPGACAAAFAIVALFASRSRWRLAYAAGLVFSFLGSLGYNAPLYPLLHAYVPGLDGIRVPARFSTLVYLSLGVLASMGLAAVRSRLGGSPRLRQLATAAVLAAATVEYSSRLGLARVPDRVGIDRQIAELGDAVLLELPLPRADDLGRTHDSRYMYHSIYHWKPLLNGYSGFFPPRYLELLHRLRDLPSGPAIGHLRARGVTHIVVHRDLMTDAQFDRIHQGLTGSGGIRQIAHYRKAPRETLLYEIDRASIGEAGR
jgi:hypothetical protein